MEKTASGVARTGRSRRNYNRGRKRKTPMERGPSKIIKDLREWEIEKLQREYPGCPRWMIEDMYERYKELLG